MPNAPRAAAARPAPGAAIPNEAAPRRQQAVNPIADANPRVPQVLAARPNRVMVEPAVGRTTRKAAAGPRRQSHEARAIPTVTIPPWRAAIGEILGTPPSSSGIATAGGT